MFGKLRHQLSRREKDSSSTPDSHPQGNSAPATRRPANPPGIMNPFTHKNDAPPPPYTPAENAAPSSPATSSTSPTVEPGMQTIADDRYAFLSSFDTIFLIDDSGSMAGGRWRETAEALKTITPICTAHDEDGIDIYFLNRKDSEFHQGVKDAARVEQIFNSVKPGGGTPTGQRLNQILKPYLRRLEKEGEAKVKPINLICITDGEPSDDVESPLIATAKKLDKLDAPAWQVGVQFFQVGRDEEASKHLKALDDELAEIAGDDELRDIVDTVPFKGVEGTVLTGDGILKVVLGAVNRRLDRKKSKDLHR